ncbi:MAG: FAD-binding oxidoreductase [Acidimicrobiia bacterium]|nr:FAD-binding oxidoreductase [Acidimicrobiia bacterium]
MGSVLGVSGESTLTEEEAAALRDEVVAELALVVGDRWVTAEPAILDGYAWQYLAEAATGERWMARPLAVVLPGCTEDVAEIVRHCNHKGIQFKAVSTGFGAWGAAAQPDSMVQIDLRRMDRILEIDAKNMYAVVEPYVTGNQLQTEAFSVGLNTHIAGVGGQTSVLASATSMMGQGWDGVSMSFSCRNLLGAEWVTPEGEIVRIGSFESAGRWFAGDGPGPSIRGVFRGFAGALGGLGVFTKAAVKLYPWEGPEALEVGGASPYYETEIPEHHLSALCIVDDWKGMAELGYRLGDAGIALAVSRNAPSVMGAVLTADNNEFADIYEVPFVHELYYTLVVIIQADDAEEFAYKVDVLKTILRELDGGMIANLPAHEYTYWLGRFIRTLSRRVKAKGLLKSAPGTLGLFRTFGKRYGYRKLTSSMSALLYEAVVRSGLNMRGVFRFGGTFWTAMGSLASWDNAIKGARVGAQIKKRYIDEGKFFDDGADNAWGGLYENGAYSHLEELACYDPTDDDSGANVIGYIFETNLASAEHFLSLPLNACGPQASTFFSPLCGGYQNWQLAIKNTYDPNNASEGSSYVIPDYKPGRGLRKLAGNVMSDRAEIDLTQDDL